MLNKAKHKTRLTQKKKKNKTKQTSNATSKNKKIKESDESFFFHTLEEPFL